MAQPVTPNLPAFADDALLDALLMEIAALLETFLLHDRPGAIDLLGLPLSPACLAALEARLGSGEIAATLNVSGESLIRETKFCGVWWTRHADESGRVVALLIEVVDVPEILRAGREDMEQARRHLTGATNVYAFAARHRQ